MSTPTIPNSPAEAGQERTSSTVRYSVVIPTFDREELLRATIASVRAAARDRRDIEIIVVDDGSTDGTGPYITAITDDPEVIYIRQPDRGFRAARARNLGLRLARGLDAVLLDCGVAVQQNFFSSLDDRERGELTVRLIPVVGFSNNDQANAALSHALATTTEDPAEALRDHEQFADVRESTFRRCADDLEALPAPWALAWTCCLVVPRRGPLSTVWFDERFVGWGGEDLEFALQLHRCGARFVLDRRTGALHLPHAKSESTNTRSSLVNKEYLHFKHRLAETRLLREMPAIELNDHLLNQALSSL